MKLGAGAFNKTLVSYPKMLDELDNKPGHKRWNPRKLGKNLAKTAVLAGLAVLLVKGILLLCK